MTSCYFWCHLQNVRLPVFPALTTLSSLLGKTEINSKSKGAHVQQSFMLAFQLPRSWLQGRKWKAKDIFFLEPLQFWPSQLADDQLIKQVWLAAPGSSKGLFSDTLAQFLLNKDSCHVVDLLKTFSTTTALIEDGLIGNLALAQSSFSNLMAIISWFTCLKNICMLFHLGINFYLF